MQNKKELKESPLQYTKGVEWGYCSPHCTQQAEKVRLRVSIIAEVPKIKLSYQQPAMS